MKKFALIVTVSLISFSLFGCSGNESNDETFSQTNESITQETGVDTDTQKDDDSGSEQIMVDEGLFNVELTLPASFVGEGASGELTEEDIANGFKSAKLNSDGSITYTISKSDYENLLEDLRQTIRETIASIPDDAGSISEVRLNDDFSEATVIISNREQFENGFDSFAIFGVYMQVAFYHIFAKSPEEDSRMIINIQDESTSEIFNTYVYPDDLN